MMTVCGNAGVSAFLGNRRHPPCRCAPFVDQAGQGDVVDAVQVVVDVPFQVGRDLAVLTRALLLESQKWRSERKKDHE